MASGELAPDSVFFDFSIAETVIIGSDGSFQGCYLPLSLFLLQKFIQNRRLRIGAPPPRLLLQIRKTRWGERKCAPLLNVWVSVRHNTVYHIIGMITMANPGRCRPQASAELRSAWTGEGARPYTSPTQTRQAASLQENCLEGFC
jgi:hypothetical protein